ncbi:hypothetical protein GY45DRAFT_1132875 [Cubamyces sp. BRFM 1775]|nr:hypothetical protein GY45DRAFT_1132875 [Cubamyces sp. BRFM 1775]
MRNTRRTGARSLSGEKGVNGPIWYIGHLLQSPMFNSPEGTWRKACLDERQSAWNAMNDELRSKLNQLLAILSIPLRLALRILTYPAGGRRGCIQSSGLPAWKSKANDPCRIPLVRLWCFRLFGMRSRDGHG